MAFWNNDDEEQDYTKGGRLSPATARITERDLAPNTEEEKQAIRDENYQNLSCGAAGLPKSAMNPQVREYLLSKQSQGEVGPPKSAMMPKEKSLAERYQDAAGDNSAIDSAEKGANARNTVGNVFGALSKMFGNNVDSAVQNTAAANNAKVGQARKDKQTKLDDLMTKDKLAYQDVERGRASEKFGWEQGEQGRKANEASEMANPTSKRSMLAATSGSTRALQLANEAKAAGDIEGAKTFLKMHEDLKSGNYSADDIGKMQLLDKVDYKDILNNNAAMARAKMQEDQANKRSKDTSDAEGRRNSDMKFKREETLRKQISSDPTLKDAVSTKGALDRIVALGDSKNGISDEALIMQWQKGLDPNSVVRESEFARTTQGAGLITNIEIMLQKAASGQRLTPEMRQNIQNSMRTLRNSQAAYANSKLGVIDNAVREYGLTPDNIYGSYYQDLRTPEQAPVGAPAAQTAPPVTQPAIDPAAKQAAMVEKAKAAVADPNTPPDVKASAQKVIDKFGG